MKTLQTKTKTSKLHAKKGKNYASNNLFLDITFCNNSFNRYHFNLGKENKMISTTYKRENGKVVEISSENSNLGNNDAEAVLLHEYEALFNKIDKGSNVVSFIRTSEYKDSLIDILQSTIEYILKNKLHLEANNMQAFLKDTFNKFAKNWIRSETRYSIFKNDNLEFVIENRESGITDKYISECLSAIKDRLTKSEYRMFNLYHVGGYKLKEIEVKLNLSYRQTYQLLNRVMNKIDSLKISYLYNSRYATYNSPGKKRQHKRKVMSNKEFIELCGITYKVAIDDYTEPIEVKREVIPNHKLPFNEMQSCYHEVLIDSTDFVQIADMGAGYKRSKTILRNVKSNSIVLPVDNPVKINRSNSYRMKKYKRMYIRIHGIDKFNEYMKRDIFNNG